MSLLASLLLLPGLPGAPAQPPVEKDPPARVAPQQAQALWEELASSDARKAYQAMCALIQAPCQAVPVLREKLKAVPPVDRKHIDSLLKDLESKSFNVRQKAMQSLEKLHDLAEPALREILAGKPSLEMRQRVEQLLKKVEVLSGESLRGVRAVETLEYIGTPEARQVLEALAAGAPEARLTREASESLQRLKKR
jgi:hypothetical protein